MMDRILIIEDDAVARRQLTDLFRFEGFEVYDAGCGQTGIKSALDAPPDLVVCDIMMPGTDGFGVLEAIRKVPETALTPFIFLTAKASIPDVRLGMSQGADDYITKPFDPEALIASARQRLARRRLQREEAERRAAETGVQAATALPREMEACLAHLETISDFFAARHEGDPEAIRMRTAMREDLVRLRTLSQRLRLYAELPGLYARRFKNPGSAPARCSHYVALEAARNAAEQWVRTGDLCASAASGEIPMPADSVTTVVRELIDNACKFSPPSTEIRLEAKPERGYWKMAVSDRGLGMRPDQIKEVGAFKQFWDAGDQPRGLGLGLTLVQALTRLHQGEVLIESQQPAGTCVTVMVPTE